MVTEKSTDAPIILPDGGQKRVGCESSWEQKVVFRRWKDSKVQSEASVENDYVLMLTSEGTGDWMKRVPGERRAVLEGQKLWRIPDNWEHYARITNEDAPDEILYRIPEAAVPVVLRDLAQSAHDRAGYTVETVGGVIEMELTEMPDKQALRDLIDRIDVDEDDETATEVKGALQDLLNGWHLFEMDYIRYYKKWSTKNAMEAFKAEHDVTFDSWSIEPWDVRQVYGHLLADICRGGREVYDSVNELLIDADVISSSPTVTITIEDRHLPIGYRVQALIEAGCSPTEAVDYLIRRFRDESHHYWENVRTAEHSETRENAESARNNLKS